MRKNRWDGKVAWVTGASSGIGRAIAERLLSDGLKVCVSARREKRLIELRDQFGDRVLPLQVDVTREESVQAAGTRIREAWGGLDVLVNNAGVGYNESLLEGSAARFREMLDVNVLGLLLTTREGVSLMRGRNEGHVFHLGSLAGHRVPPGSNVYGATKYAVRSLAESLRQELVTAELPIRVTTISPGYVATEFHEHYFGSKESAAQLYEKYQVLTADDIADTVLYALHTPPHVAVHDVLVRSRFQPN